MAPSSHHTRPPIVLVMGVSGSGKSAVGVRLASRLGLPHLDADSLHPETNVRKMRAGAPLTDSDRGPWLDAVAARIVDAGGGLVVSCSALRRLFRDRLRRAAPELRLVFLTGPDDLIRSRLAGRVGHFMPASLLESQLETLEPPTADERPIVTDISPPPEEIAEWVEARLRGDLPAT
jgi:gluconokinase